MARKSRKRTGDDRVSEYVDSPMMTQRLQYGRELTARIQGNYGTYRTRVLVGRASDGRCTCPSEVRPCKHDLALEATWQSHPDTFFELEEVLEELTDQSRAQLIEMIAQMALAAPESLVACGVEEFAFDDEIID